MNKLLQFKVEGRAVAKERPRLTKYGGAFTPQKTVDWENKVASAWNDKFGMLSLEGKLRVTINIYTDRHKIQDVDNLAKSILDGMDKAGAFAKSDAQVYSLGVIKYEAKTDLCVMVSVIGIDDYSDDHR